VLEYAALPFLFYAIFPFSVPVLFRITGSPLNLLFFPLYCIIQNAQNAALPRVTPSQMI
jgi:hypothetical protein